MYIGIDLVKIERIKICDSFIDKVLSQEEKEILKNIHNKREYLAGHFALKEAIIKTFEGKETILMNEISIINDDNGYPVCKYKDYKIKGSISHEKEYAVATALRME